ncbi:MAG: hypothetical protein KDB22_09685 [Planctomycetales bacterium]|nr:hypothetical protein [Planctomycetales bacterium]
MTVLANSDYRDYRAPAGDNSALIEPDLDQLVSHVSEANATSSGSGLEFCGNALDQVQAEARREVVELAVRYTSAYQSIDPVEFVQQPIILSGHQPELFHPGVWFKNFLLSAIASRVNGIGVNFLVDNDLCRSTNISVPSFPANESSSVLVRDIPFDESRTPVPWELRSLQSRATWDAFSERVVAALPSGMRQPLLTELWPDASVALDETGRPGLAIARARHQLEQRIGLQTLEVPLSHLVSTRAFARFSIQLLSELPRFQDSYNRQLKRYREAHRIRNHAHPVPALEQQDGWLEAPWWVYRKQAPQRQRLWVRVRDDQLILCDRAGWQTIIEGRLDCDNASSQWLDLQVDGVCLRPRALLTTMYLRMIVGNVFIHGIGGAKYDQLTDTIIRDFFGVESPLMGVASATLRLPWPEPKRREQGRAEQVGEAYTDNTNSIRAQIRALKRELWDLRFHADQTVGMDSVEAKSLVERKRELLANIPDKGDKWQWHREMTNLNRRLAELASGTIAQTRQRMNELAKQEKALRIAQSREYSFCLYPLDFVAGHLQRML